MISDYRKKPSYYNCEFYGMYSKVLTIYNLPIQIFTYTLTGNVIWWIYLLLIQLYKVTNVFKTIGSKIKKYMKSEIEPVGLYKDLREEYIKK